MDKENKLKIVQCNIQRRANQNELEKLLEKVSEQNADIIIFTEYTNALRQEVENKLQEEYPKYYIDDFNSNGIAMFISSSIKEKSHFVSLCRTKGKIYPDLVCAEIDVSSQKIIIAGVRFQNYSFSSLEDFVQQFLNYLLFIKEKKPDILIGDYNWDSAFYGNYFGGKYMERTIDLINKKEITDESFFDIQSVISELNITIPRNTGRGGQGIKKFEDSEQTLCGVLNCVAKDKKYTMWPTDNIEAWSHVTKEKGRIVGVSSPDRIVYDTNSIIGCEAYYYPHVDRENGFTKEWSSDHAMMIATLTV